MKARRPLAGVGVAVTRARFQASGFARALRGLGADVCLCPLIRLADPPSFRPLDRALRGLESYDWLIFTSANAVERFRARYRLRRGRARFPARIRTCAIGPATAAAMRRCGIPAHRISKDYVAESVLEEIPDPREKKILIPRALEAREILPKTLAARGADVDVVPVYRTVPDRAGLSGLRRRLAGGGLRCVTFTSSSTVQSFFSVLGRKDRSALRASGRVQAASIGPVTTVTLKKYGWAPRIIAAKPTTAHLARAIAQYYAAGKDKP